MNLHVGVKYQNKCHSRVEEHRPRKYKVEVKRSAVQPGLFLMVKGGFLSEYQFLKARRNFSKQKYTSGIIDANGRRSLSKT